MFYESISEITHKNWVLWGVNFKGLGVQLMLERPKLSC